MDPAIATLDLDPPRERVWRRGLLPAVAVNGLLFALLLGGGHWTLPWERPGPLRQAQVSAAGAAPARAVAAPGATGTGRAPAAPAVAAPAEPADDTSRMGAPAAPAPSRAAAVPEAAPRPSFDCARARSTNERLICGDAQLARLDRALGALHQRARAAAPDAAAFQAASARAWREREQRCRDRACLLAWFDERRTQLQAQLGEP